MIQPPLSRFDFNTCSLDFLRAAGEHGSVVNLTKFLCGVYTPLFTKLKIKALPHFGALERYPFPAVRQWVAEQQS